MMTSVKRLRTAEAAKVAGVSERTVRLWIDHFGLRAFDLSAGQSRRRLFVDENDLAEFLRRRTVGGAA